MKARLSGWVVTSVLCISFLLWGCGGGSGGSPAGGAPTTGSISGTLIVPGAPASAKPSGVQGLSSEGTMKVVPPTEKPDFVPGEIIVRFKDGIAEEEALSKLLKDYQDVQLTNAGQIYPGGPYLLRTNAYKNDSISKEEAKQQTEVVISRLNNEPSVKYAEPNYIQHAKLLPNDPAFIASLQWDLRMINLPTAWEMTTGGPDMIVSVVDTGVRFNHPDLTPNLLTTGFDFVSDPFNAGDGDGIDPDPTDPLSPFASFHGTHVAGTISAVSNNGSGVAGVAWNVKIMPVRVLGQLGMGSLSDIINGLRYAAGLSNVSGEIPPQHARVINMSLGGPGSCSQAYQETLTAVRNAGVTVVVAAGNDGDKGNPIETPASCEGVITVGAVNPSGERAYYSGFQPYVFIAAPGGDTSETPVGGVLSTFTLSGTNEPLYTFYQGTSMAAPHVSGVIALMLSTNPSLTPSQIENILSSTATDLGPVGRDPEFGFGLIDAGRAVARAKGVALPTVPVPYPQEPLLIFDQPLTSSFIDDVVLNTGGGMLELFGVTPSVIDPPGGTWLSASLLNDPFTCGLTAFNCIIRVSVDQAGLSPGLYSGFIIVTSNGGNFALVVILQVGSPTLPDMGDITVRLLTIDPKSQELVVAATTTTNASKNYRFNFSSIPPGDYLIDAGTDQDHSGFFGDAPDEISGVYPFRGEVEPVEVVAGQTIGGIDFSVTDEETILTFPQAQPCSPQSDNMPPDVPRNLTATAVSSSEIDLIWPPSTDNVGVTSYLIERCLTANCTFVQITVTTTSSYRDTGLMAGTTYSYRIRATDCAGNLSPYSNTASATTSADAIPPTAPSNLAATSLSSSQIYLTWTASTDNFGVASYYIYRWTQARCLAENCLAPIAIVSGTSTSYLDIGLVASTTYAYTVSARDAAGNLSYESNTASVATLADTTGLGTWTTKTPMPTPRRLLATGVANNILYAVGGSGSSGTALTTIEAYNPINNTNTWIGMTPMPTAREGLAIGVVNNILYAVGGSTGFSPGLLQTVEAYNAMTNTWMTMAPMPTPRAYFAIGVVNNILYAIGGVGTGTSGPLSTVEAYNPSTNTWTTMAPMPTPRYGLAVGVINNFIYAIGGCCGDLATVEVYNPVMNTWATKASMPTARQWLAADVVNNILYAIGGVSNNNFLATVDAYDPVTDTWSPKNPMNIPRAQMAAGVVNNVLYVVGGTNQTSILGTLEAFTP